ncbi:MAG: hypothetical protein JXL20_12940 [Deltaproteobacteria bacterium]|nr:hypothetical protein [Deltaproteobacteria bacterium]
MGKLFVLECKASSSVSPVKAAIEHLRSLSLHTDLPVILLVCVPFMGDSGRRLCEEAGIGWIDLSGNGRIMGPALHVRVEGRANRFKAKGRPADIFAPKSSRIARWLLMHHENSFSQKVLAQATDMDEGFVSRIVSRMLKEGMIRRDENGNVSAHSPSVLLDAWREKYRIPARSWLRGHIAARTGEALLRQLAHAMEDQGVAYAATGLGAAWLHNGFAAFRIATLYVNEIPPAAWLESIGFRAEPQGANVWLIEPKDEGVFQGAREIAGIRCVHPVQIYLDLKDHPERAAEAAEQLRKDALRWEANDR